MRTHASIQTLLAGLRIPKANCLLTFLDKRFTNALIFPISDEKITWDRPIGGCHLSTRRSFIISWGDQKDTIWSSFHFFARKSNIK